jgi:hypothetical protein
VTNDAENVVASLIRGGIEPGKHKFIYGIRRVNGMSLLCRIVSSRIFVS